MAVDNLFDRQELYEILYERMPVLFFLKRFFNGTPAISNKEHLRLEYYKEGKIASAYVGRRQEGQFVDHVNLQSKPVEPPYLKPKALTSVTTRSERMTGENPFNSQESEQSRKARDIGEKFAMLERQIQRAIELQCSDFLSSGKVSVRNLEGKKLREVNFDMPSSHRVTLSTDERWNHDDAKFWAGSGKAKKQVKVILVTLNTKSNGITHANYLKASWVNFYTIPCIYHKWYK